MYLSREALVAGLWIVLPRISYQHSLWWEMNRECSFSWNSNSWPSKISRQPRSLLSMIKWWMTKKILFSKDFKEWDWRMFQKQALVLTPNNPDLRVALCFPPLSPLISLRNLKFSKRMANLSLPMESLLNHVTRPCIRTNYKPLKQG